MPTLNLLYKDSYPVNEHIKIIIPKVKDILEHEDDYYNMVMMLTAMPIDMMVQLDDMGIDFTTINEYDLFQMVFETLKTEDTSLIFGDLDLSRFRTAVSENGNQILLNPEGVRIDRLVANKIAVVLRKIHDLKQNTKTPGNEEAKKYMLERARVKMRRAKKRLTDSYLEQQIVAMVNTEQYHYGFEGTLELSIYQFNKSVRQVIKKVDYEHLMHGVYAGTISSKDLSQKDLNWISNE